MPEVLMDYDEVGLLSEQLGEAESELGAGRDALANGPETTRAYSSHYVDDFNAFGNTNLGSALATLHNQARQAGETAAGHLATALGEDLIRLQDVVSCFQENDHGHADQVCSSGGGNTLSIYSTHLHSGGSYAHEDPPQVVPDWQAPPVPADPFPEPTDKVDKATANDYVRADQIDRFGEILQESPGVVGADLNTEPDPGSHSGVAVQDLTKHGFDIDAGWVEGGTYKDRHIDYVITPPGVTAQHPLPVNGGSSDHDGQRVDLTIGRW